MAEWHPLRSKDDDVSARWNELNRQAEERGKTCQSAEMPTLDHASMKDYHHVYEPSDDTYLLLDGLLADLDAAVALQSNSSNTSSSSTSPLIILEIGTGSGVPITFLAKQLIANNKMDKTAETALHAMATDINPQALEFAGKTAKENGVVSAVLTLMQCDLATPLLEKYCGRVNVIIFNPPYVPTPDDEVAGNGIEASWAGGEKGRRVIDRALPQIAQLLSRPNGICYMITVDDNEPEDMSLLLSSKYDLTMRPLVRRRAHNEYLTVQKVMCRVQGTE